MEANEVQFTVLSWNIDGLHELEIKRTWDICDKINTLKPDVVLLQEVISDTLALIKKRCKGYTFTTSIVTHYFNTIMVRKHRKFNPEKEEMLVFNNSVMGRYLLMKHMTLKGIPFTFMTSHLESTNQHSASRKEQMDKAFQEMVKRGETRNIIFCGDMNIRDFEIEAIGGLPSGVTDAWEFCGCKSEARYTWDMRTNDNMDFPHPPPPRRFDRMYYTSLILPGGGLKCRKFELIGLERIEGLGCFPSDHYGLVATFSLITGYHDVEEEEEEVKEHWDD